jgi:ubiquinone/menaquinone biosynthesis C-methylase UbiE
MSTRLKYDEKQSRATERIYRSPEIARQRLRTLERLALTAGERVLDVGCGPGFLVRDMAMTVGTQGRVVGVDSSEPMLELATRRCSGFEQIQLTQGHAEVLDEADEAFDAVACTQVLLYVTEVEGALAEMHRVLKTGARIAIVETDWRGAVIGGPDSTMSRRVLDAWDESVASPNLPVKLGPLLRKQGFTALSVEAIPLLCTSYTPNNYAVGMLESLAAYAQKRGAVGKPSAERWLANLKGLGAAGEFFFCVNRFLFCAVKA